MTQYAYNLSIHSTIDINLFYVMYDYNSEIELKIENDLSRKKMSTVKERIKELHKFKQTLSQCQDHVTNDVSCNASIS